ncbi:MAG: RidA family protein [Deltaproteobacteria bacterium]|nr:RidA family protein [Deltaproteobacteria bacterium]
MDIEGKLKKLGLQLPKAPSPVGNYVTVLQTGPYVYTSGHIPVGLTFPGEPAEWKGILGADLDVNEGYRAARSTVLLLLATLKDFLGDLNRVQRIVKVTGFVRSQPEFEQQPQVVNGASDLLVELFGERGKHVRSAVGVAGLPKGVPVEIEMVVEAAPEHDLAYDVSG